MANDEVVSAQAWKKKADILEDMYIMATDMIHMIIMEGRFDGEVVLDEEMMGHINQMLDFAKDLNRSRVETVCESFKKELH